MLLNIKEIFNCGDIKFVFFIYKKKNCVKEYIRNCFYGDILFELVNW